MLYPRYSTARSDQVPSSAAAICASQSTARGLETTSATAGLAASFVIQSRDLYGLPVAPDAGTFVVSFLHEKGNHSFSAITHKEDGTVESVTISAGGSSCTAGGTLAAAGGGGSGFAALFTVSGGAINAITITNKGFGYIYEPILWIDSGGAGCTGYDLEPVIRPVGDFVGAASTTVSGKYQASPLLIAGHGLNASYFNFASVNKVMQILKLSHSRPGLCPLRICRKK